MSADLAVPIRDALIAAPSITALLAPYLNSYAIFTRRPVPTDANYPMLVVSEPITNDNTGDGVNDFRPVIEHDVIAFGRNQEPSEVNAIDSAGLLVQQLFHRKRLSLTVSGWYVAQVLARGPLNYDADDQVAARVVTLTVTLSKRPQ